VVGRNLATGLTLRPLPLPSLPPSVRRHDSDDPSRSPLPMPRPDLHNPRFMKVYLTPSSCRALASDRARRINVRKKEYATLKHRTGSTAQSSLFLVILRIVCSVVYGVWFAHVFSRPILFPRQEFLIETPINF
jgi:hypothetical protein